MKSGKKIVALLLTFCLVFGTTAPVYAADRTNSRRPGYSSSFEKGWNDFWNWLTGKGNQGDKGETEDTTEKTDNSLPKLKLVEDETTVENGDLLRAATYAVDEPVAQADTVKYFPITMFDYDQVKFNDVVRGLELADKEIKDYPEYLSGMYMGNDKAKTYTYNEEIIFGGSEHGNVYYEKVDNPANNIDVNAKYVLVSGDGKRPFAIGVNSDNQLVKVANEQTADLLNPISNATVWSVSHADNDKNNYYAFSCTNNNGETRYLKINDYYTPNTVEIERNAVRVREFPSDSNRLMLCIDEGMRRLHNDSKGVGAPFVTWYNDTDENSFYLYKVVEGEKKQTVEVNKTVGYARHNSWTGGNKIYQGLAKNELDVNGQIGFNKLDAGLFTEKAVDGKQVYTNVGLPFEYNSDEQRYSFNAKEMGAWFEGTPASGVNLTYSKTQQAHTAGQDKTAAGWFPFDDSTNTKITSVQGAEHAEKIDAKDVGARPNHYFGMAASIDFTMTQDGMLKDGETPIDFHFSGDDDVWVFIDGKLVLDMGGIHNRINGDINFKQGKWSINQAWKDNPNHPNNKDEIVGEPTEEQAEDINNGTQNTSGDLWKTLGTDLVTFAAKETHTLSVFYLERGAGASNCEITFNLPMKDYVSVTKDATKDSEGTSLTEKEQETVNNMDFTYTIYRNGEPYANQVYTLLNATTGNAIGNAYTNASGQFTIKNNQTARFTTAFSEKGEKWYVEEMDPGAAFVNDETKWSSTSVTINGEEKGSNTGLISNTVEVIGSEEASGKINFLCENILDAKLANPGIVTADDRIVIDYGLPVQIDVKSNDLFRADNYEVVEISGAKFGDVKITDAKNGQLEYQLTEQLTDVEELTYTVEVSSTVLTHPEIPGSDETQTETARATGKVYVIPATSMYYEENFKNSDGTDMITYKTEWETKGTANGEYQEPGVVQTTTDSPYGSDIAYLNDSGDSNGTSRYISTETLGNAFKYTFTGTGTSFFARTTNNSGYIRVTVKDSADNIVDQIIIDTRFLNNTGKRLYNIPVYTFKTEDKGLEYDTYTVSVSILKKSNSATVVYGTDFWLDGIRVQNPMNPKSENYQIAETAYSDDGEANVNIETLRDKVIDSAGFDDNGDLILGDGFAVLTDINNNITSASDYESIGPKQEVYLAGNGAEGVANAQKISFTLEQWDMNHKLYLGLKAPMGEATVSINGKNLTVSNTSDCYYNLTDGGYINVDEDGNAKIEIQAVSGVVSITNIKTTGALKFDIIPGDEFDKDNPEGDETVDGEEIIGEEPANVEKSEDVKDLANVEEPLEAKESTDVKEPANVENSVDIEEAVE